MRQPTAREILLDVACREARFYDLNMGDAATAHAIYTLAADRLGPLSDTQAREAERIAQRVATRRAA